MATMIKGVPPGGERAQTDESLRAERSKVDDALSERFAAIEEAADAVILRARTRADEVLAATRAKTDRGRTDAAPAAAAGIARERFVEDQTLQRERDGADEVRRVEREEHVALLSTERQETDKDLRSERTRSDASLSTRDEFLSIVSHDLRNMLNAIVGFARLISAEVRQENPIASVVLHAQRIERASGHMHRLVGDLIDVASIEAGSMAVAREVADLALAAQEAVDTLQAHAAASGLSLTAEAVPPATLALFDPARVLQVLINLLSNAIKFTPRGGAVVVRTERVGSELRCSVRDTGIGIPQDQLEAVFERFLQVNKADRRGSGLGLYISKCIIQGHGGRIWAESAVGVGSTVCFTLPLDGAV